MNKKDYRGYELIKAIHDGEIKDGAIIEVHDLSTLDHIKARITFRNKKLNWISGEFDTSCLFDDNIYFRVLEDNTEEIEELIVSDEGFIKAENGCWKGRKLDVTFANKINKIIRYIKRKDKSND